MNYGEYDKEMKEWLATLHTPPVVEVEKTEILFELSLPNNSSVRDIYARTVKGIARGKNKYPNLEEKGYYYKFSNGYGAHINVRYVQKNEAKDKMKKSKGFCGYDWMIDSILTKGKIIATGTDEQND